MVTFDLCSVLTSTTKLTQHNVAGVTRPYFQIHRQTGSQSLYRFIYLHALTSFRSPVARVEQMSSRSSDITYCCLVNLLRVIRRQSPRFTVVVDNERISNTLFVCACILYSGPSGQSITQYSVLRAIMVLIIK
jgi:hypothetical protein